jgi:DNA transformation protein
MPVSPNFLDFALDQLSGLRAVRARPMFGGIGLYSDDVFFGVIDDDTVYFKVGDSNRADYTARGCEPFRPYGDVASMNYFRVPSDVLDDADELIAWARKSLAVANAAASAKTARKSRPRTASQTTRKAKKPTHR